MAHEHHLATQGALLGRNAYADRALMLMLYNTLAAQAIVLLIFNFTAHSQIMSAVCIFLMAAFGFATVSLIRKLVMDNAQAAGAPTLAAAVSIGLFNLGNALGAWRGGAMIAAKLGLQSPNWAGAVLSVIALMLATLSGLTDRVGRAAERDQKEGKADHEHALQVTHGSKQITQSCLFSSLLIRYE